MYGSFGGQWGDSSHNTAPTASTGLTPPRRRHSSNVIDIVPITVGNLVRGGRWKFREAEPVKTLRCLDKCYHDLETTMSKTMTLARATEFGLAWNSRDPDLVASFFADDGSTTPPLDRLASGRLTLARKKSERAPKRFLNASRTGDSKISK